ncbi:hypothetical protein G7046_g7060 [Stylonectria norvegica]|nr:hypothetical protein G7046_g7060 [Stylonectria norvegica]
MLLPESPGVRTVHEREKILFLTSNNRATETLVVPKLRRAEKITTLESQPGCCHQPPVNLANTIALLHAAFRCKAVLFCFPRSRVLRGACQANTIMPLTTLPSTPDQPRKGSSSRKPQRGTSESFSSNQYGSMGSGFDDHTAGSDRTDVEDNMKIERDKKATKSHAKQQSDRRSSEYSIGQKHKQVAKRSAQASLFNIEETTGVAQSRFAIERTRSWASGVEPKEGRRSASQPPALEPESKRLKKRIPTDLDSRGSVDRGDLARSTAAFVTSDAPIRKRPVVTGNGSPNVQTTLTTVETLRGDHMLYGKDIAACLRLLVRDSAYCLLESARPMAAPSDRIWPRHIVFTYCVNEHWTVGHLDCYTQKFAHYNSMSQRTQYESVLNNAKEWVKEHRIGPVECFKWQDKACPQQVDGFNCGIFAIVVAGSLVSGRPIPNTIDVASYRSFFAEHLEKNTAKGSLSLPDLAASCETESEHTDRSGDEKDESPKIPGHPLDSRSKSTSFKLKNTSFKASVGSESRLHATPTKNAIRARPPTTPLVGNKGLGPRGPRVSSAEAALSTERWSLKSGDLCAVSAESPGQSLSRLIEETSTQAQRSVQESFVLYRHTQRRLAEVRTEVTLKKEHIESLREELRDEEEDLKNLEESLRVVESDASTAQAHQERLRAMRMSRGADGL